MSVLPGKGDPDALDVAGQRGIGKPESGDSGPARPSDTKLGMKGISQRTVLGGIVVPQGGRGPFKDGQGGMPLGKLSSTGDRVRKHVYGPGGGEAGRWATCKRMDPVSRYVISGA